MSGLNAISIFAQVFYFNFILVVIFLKLTVLEYLRHFNETLKSQMTDPNNRSKLPMIIKIASKFSLLICDTLNNISVCFTVFAITGHAIQSRTEVLCIYSIYVYIKEPTVSHFGFFLLNLTTLLLLWPCYIAIISISTKIQQEGKLTLEIIQEGMTSTTTEMSSKNFKHLQVLSQQMFHQSPVVSFSGCRIDMNFAFNYACDIFSSSIFFSSFYELMK